MATLKRVVYACERALIPIIAMRRLAVCVFSGEPSEHIAGGNEPSWEVRIDRARIGSQAFFEPGTGEDLGVGFRHKRPRLTRAALLGQGAAFANFKCNVPDGRRLHLSMSTPRMVRLSALCERLIQPMRRGRNPAASSACDFKAKSDR